MKRLELNTDDETLGEILSNGKTYYIPKFQRDYSWENEQWENLWEDMIALVEKKEQYHYMGYLVIQPPAEEDGASKIIDGQQRLTTFSLIILAAIRRLKELGDVTGRIEELQKNFIGSKDLVYLEVKSKLKLNRNNDYYYCQAVEGHALPTRGNKKTVHLMQKAIEYYYSQFKTFNAGEKIGEMIKLISSRLLFTTIYIGNELNAYKIFETLNARAVQLSSGDLLKNHIFSLVDKDNDTPEDILDALDAKWEKIGSNIGDQNYTNYIFYEWNSRNRQARRSELFKKIKEQITDRKSAKRYLNELERKSYWYAALLNHEDEFWKDRSDYSEIKAALAFLKLFRITQTTSLLIAAYDKMPDDFCQILKWIQVFSIRYNVICKKHTGEQEALYNKISLLINEGKNKEAIKQKLLEAYPNDERFKQDFAEKALPTEQSNKKARYILARLAEAMNKKNPIDESRLTIEHILPLKPNDDWIEYFGEHWNLFNERIGNMALVTSQENKKLGQAPFDEKSEILSQSEYDINKTIDYEEWTPDTIRSRQNALAQMASQLWRIG